MTAKKTPAVEVPLDDIRAVLPGLVVVHAEPAKRPGAWIAHVARIHPRSGETIVRNGQIVTHAVEVRP